MPSCCPYSGPGDPPCVLSILHRRPRKTGPRFPVTVVQCRTHGHGFTLYPPSYAPYARQPVLQLGPDGTSVQGEKASSPSGAAGMESSKGVSAGLWTDFEGTLFHAALDAGEGRPWARDSLEEIPDKWWPTQGRHLGLAVRLLGLAEGFGARLRESIAQVLSVDLLFLKDQEHWVRDHPGYRGLGCAVCRVLSLLKGGARRARDLLFCGYLVGRWGRPLHWDPQRKILEHLPFPRPGPVA